MAYRSLEEAIIRGRGRERAFRCPVHGDREASASVNVIKGLWVCYACGARGTTDGTLDVEVTDFTQMIDELMETTTLATYPERWLEQFTTRPGPYWSTRFTPEAIEHFRLGFDWQKIRPCYPMRDTQGRLLGVVYRNLEDTGPKYLYPRGVNKSHLLFNYSPEHSPSIVLVEGALDAVAVWEAGHRALALYGSMLHREQVTLLQRVAPRRIVLALDNDDAGARAMYGFRNDEGKKIPGIEQRLSAAGFEVVMVDWQGREEKDIAECSIATRRTLLDHFAI